MYIYVWHFLVAPQPSSHLPHWDQWSTTWCRCLVKVGCFFPWFSSQILAKWNDSRSRGSGSRGFLFSWCFLSTCAHSLSVQLQSSCWKGKYVAVYSSLNFHQMVHPSPKIASTMEFINRKWIRLGCLIFRYIQCLSHQKFWKHFGHVRITSADCGIECSAWKMPHGTQWDLHF